jgi:hypothetical protein
MHIKFPVIPKSEWNPFFKLRVLVNIIKRVGAGTNPFYELLFLDIIGWR